MRIKILGDNNELYTETYQNKNLMTVLLENNIFLSNVCNGNGMCGKCKIKVISGNLPITEADRRCLSEEELARGVRLACKAMIGTSSEEELCVEVVGNTEENIVVEGIDKNLGEYHEKRYEIKESVELEQGESTGGNKKNQKYFIAIDLGTTTIAMALVNENTGEILDTYTSMNHQRKFGADVISRITASNAGNAEELKQLIEQDLWIGICKLTKTVQKMDFKAQNESEEEKNENIISKIIISGNTTMIHLLMGYSCQSLGKYPFVSEHLGEITCKLRDCIRTGKRQLSSEVEVSLFETEEVYEKYRNIPVSIFPAISAFVGGDIVADLLICSGFETEEINLLVDLGTNGEMVLGSKDKLLATSTAAGPAFEGGNIVWGTASIPGSISRVKIQNQRAIIKTIQDKLPPVGICGTGLVSCVAELIRNDLVDESGALKYPYQEPGFSLWTFENGEKIALYQKDIREFQMAKAAIRAGIDILLEKNGCTPKDIQHVYLAGGFGVNLSVEDAISTGILPEELKEKIVPIGNGALKGAIRLGVNIKNQLLDDIMKYEERLRNDSTVTGRITEILKNVKNVSLAENRKFQETYLKYLEF